MTASLRSLLPRSTRGVLLVGDYGSGKTEVAVNLALRLSETHDAVAIADLDLVNPYFRCREAQEPMERAGIRVVIPRGGHQFADLPILLPSVKGLLQDTETTAVLDVGGDEVGSRVLAALGPALNPRHHGFWFVVNANRPFCDTPDGVLRAIAGIERAAGTRVTGLVSNTHLMDETTPTMVEQGAELADQIARRLEIKIEFISIMDTVARQMGLDAADEPALSGHPVLIMKRLMVPPWLRRPAEAMGRVGPSAFKLGAS